MNKVIFTKKELYEKLTDYYLNNSLYDEVLDSVSYRGQHTVNFKYLRKNGNRNPVNRAVEFYVSKIIPGDLKSIKLQADNELLIDAIDQLFIWSNFGNAKQKQIRHLALYGNLFLKANCDGKKTWFDLIDSKNVTDYVEDSRGYITEIRIDTPIKDENNVIKNRVEYWSKTDNVWKIWVGNSNESTPVKQLGTPDQWGTISSLGISFVPIVHIKFKDIGFDDGLSCVFHALTKIEESNRQAERLHDILFRFGKPVLAISSNTVDKDGRPIALSLELEDSPYLNGDPDIWNLPGNANAESMIPDINYDSMLAILNAQLAECESDLPELKYYELAELNNVSGKALRTQMGAAVDRAEEARGNYVTGLIRIIQICLTLGSFWGLFSVGSYEKGDFEFSMELPEMFPMDDSDRMEIVNKATQAGVALPTALRLVGYSEEFIQTALEEKAVEQANKSQADLTAFSQL